MGRLAVGLVGLAFVVSFGYGAEKEGKEERTGNLVRVTVTQNRTLAIATVGDVIIFRVKDEKGAPVQNLKVTLPSGLRKLGQVQVVTDDENRRLTGGGSTWVLVKADKRGEYKVTVSYNPFGGEKTETTVSLTVGG
jgi:hypothetical protein